MRMDTISSVESWSIVPENEKHVTTCVSEFQSEFFSLIHGASMNFGYMAAEIASSTAVWGYKEIRTRRCYWLEKKELMERIIRTINISLWQKHKEKKYGSGLWAEGVCCIIGEKTAWIGCFGEASVLEVRKNGERRIMGMIYEDGYDHAKKLGMDRYRFSVAIASFPFEKGDTFIFAAGNSAALPIETLSAYGTKGYGKEMQTKTTLGGILVVRRRE